MLVKNLSLERKRVITVLKEQTVEELLEIFKKSGYRCIPVISQNGDYEGMVYKIHLKEHIYEQGGKLSDTIEVLIKHSDEFVKEDDSFVIALSKIKALPFIAVVKNKELKGILTHSSVMSVLEDSFGVKTGGVSFTMVSSDSKGMIKRLGELLKNENIEGLFTLDNGSVLMRRIVITIGKDKTDKEIEDLRLKVENAGFRVLSIERL